MKKKIATGALAALTLSFAVAGCGAATKPSTGNTAGAGKASSFKVGLVTDMGGLNDHSFNHLADVGVQKAQKELGVQATVVESNSESDYVPNLTRLASQGYNLVIAVGYLMHDAVEQVSQKYPNTKFLIIDDSITDRKNVTGELFKTEQCGYLVGAMAGLLEKTHLKGLNSQNVVGVVGGQSIPPVNSYIAGFQQGFAKTDPTGKVLVKYTNSFNDQGLGSQYAQNLISSGADIIFPVAGGAGTGSIKAAQSAGVYAIGVDADQNYIAPKTVITSALKGVDTATFDVIKATKEGHFKSGPQWFDLADGGVGIAKPLNIVPQDVISKVNDLAQQIKDGKIKVSATMKK
jgi:basic membrane protein A